RGRSAAVASVAGWAVALAAQVVLAHTAAHPAEVVGRLALGSTAGMTVGGLLLVVAVLRARGAAALAGTPRTLLATLAGGAAAWAAGLFVVGAFGAASTWASVAAGLAAGVAGVAAFAAVAVMIDREDARTLPARLRRGPATEGSRSDG
ncbi:virulence factor MviN, partial [Streptosporangium sp. NPDC048865]